MKFSLNQRPASVLGLTLTPGWICATHVTRTKGGIVADKTVTTAWKLDLLHSESEPAGLELRAHLDAAGLTERRCVVAIPASWVMVHSAKTPALAAEDLASYLHLEAEKNFPCDLDELQIAQSVCRVGEATFVTQLAVRREKLGHLAAVLKAAGLKPVSFSPGFAALPGVIPPTGEGRFTVAVEPAGATLSVAVGGGIANLRTREMPVETEAAAADFSRLGREIRITAEQMPVELRTAVRQLFFCGDSAGINSLSAILAAWAANAGLSIEQAGTTNRPLAEQMAERLASHWLEGGSGIPEFLPPQPSRWSVWRSRYNSKRLASAGVAAGAAVVLAIGAFGWQEYRLWKLRSEWGAMQVQVTDLETVQARIRDFRPWYDTSFRNLSILRRVTECFPDNGSVTAKSFEIRGLAAVSIAGTARDNSALLLALDQLRKTREVQGLKIEQIHGKTPLQFTFSFRWNPNSGS